MYKYRDFSSVDEEEDVEQESQTSSPSPPPPHTSGDTLIRMQKFPVKLYAILAQKELHEIITWMPHGRAWKVLQPSLFESLVMPLFFEYSNYHSFNRLVNAWSFRRIAAGPDRGCYYHELFLRGRPTLQKYMRRLPKTHKKLPMRKEDEPDFYAMDKTYPLPTLEESALPSQMVIGLVQPQQGLDTTPPGSAGMLSNSLGPMGLLSGMGGLSAFEPRDPLMGMMGQQRAAQASLSSSGMGTMGMNCMSSPQIGSMGGMNTMNTMGSMTSMGSLGGIGTLSGMDQWNSINGVSSIRDSSGFGSSGNDFEYQKLRQIQQMQLFDRQMSEMSTGIGGMGGMGNDAHYMSLMLNRQQC